MDKIVDHLFVFEGEGLIKDFPGNYSDYRDWVDAKEKEQRVPVQKKEKVVKPKPTKEGIRKLSFNEKRELEQLEQDIASLEQEKKVIETVMNSGDCPSEELVIKSQRHGEIRDLLDDKELRWLELSDQDS